MSDKKKGKNKQAEMPNEPLKESFDPWFIHKLSTDKEFAGYKWEQKLDRKGHQKKELVYRGSYYYFNYKGKELNRIRRKILILAIISLFLIFASCSFITTSSVSNSIISCCEVFALVPTVYEVMGIWTLCTCKEPFEMKVPMLSVRRIKSCVWGIIFLIGVAWVLTIYFLFANLGSGMLIPDLVVTIALAGGMLLQFLMRRVLLTFSLEKVGEEKDEEEDDMIKAKSSKINSKPEKDPKVPDASNKSPSSEIH